MVMVPSPRAGLPHKEKFGSKEKTVDKIYIKPKSSNGAKDQKADLKLFSSFLFKKRVWYIARDIMIEITILNNIVFAQEAGCSKVGKENKCRADIKKKPTR
jgi:hypothetical protein